MNRVTSDQIRFEGITLSTSQCVLEWFWNVSFNDERVWSNPWSVYRKTMKTCWQNEVTLCQLTQLTPAVFFRRAKIPKISPSKARLESPIASHKKNIFFKLCIKHSKQQPHFPSVSKALTLPVDPSKSSEPKNWHKGPKSEPRLATWRIIPVKWWRTMVSFRPQEPWGFFPFQMAIHPTGTPEGTKGYALFSKPSRKEALCRGIFLVTWCRLKP